MGLRVLCLFLCCSATFGIRTGHRSIHAEDIVRLVIDLVPLIETEGNWVDVGSLLRLAWHDSGTYDSTDYSGGNRACQRLPGGEADDPDNNGLELTIASLEPITTKWKHKFSNADLWVGLAQIAVAYSGGPIIPFNFGRVDCTEADEQFPNRLPNADPHANMGETPAAHIRRVFNRIGFDDRGIVALIGAHSVGRCHAEFSGFDGPWTLLPNNFTNLFYLGLTTKRFVAEMTLAGNNQFSADNGDGTIMLPTDMALIGDPEFLAIVEEYAQDHIEFFRDFTYYWQQLVERRWEGSLTSLIGVLVQEGFDFLDVDGDGDVDLPAGWRWNGHSGGISSDFGSPGGSVFITGTGGPCNGCDYEPITNLEGLVFELDQTTQVATIEFDLYLTGSGTATPYNTGIHILDENGDKLFDIEVARDEWRIPEDLVEMWVGDMPPRTWVHVIINLNWETETADVDVPGSHNHDHEHPFRTTGSEGVSAVRFFHYVDGETAYFDGVIVSDAAVTAGPAAYPDEEAAEDTAVSPDDGDDDGLPWWIILIIIICAICCCCCCAAAIWKGNQKREETRAGSIAMDDYGGNQASTKV